MGALSFLANSGRPSAPETTPRLVVPNSSPKISATRSNFATATSPQFNAPTITITGIGASAFIAFICPCHALTQSGPGAPASGLLAGAGFAPTRDGKQRRMAKGDVHVMPSETGWRVEVAADGRARSVHRTPAEAREAARAIARRNERELFVHGRDGQIRERNTYGQDPRRSKG